MNSEEKRIVEYLPNFYAEKMITESDSKIIHVLKYGGELLKKCDCGGSMYGHGTRKQRFVDTTIFGKISELQVIYPRRMCTKCSKIWEPKIEGVSKTRKMTLRLENEIVERSFKSSFEDIAQSYGLTKATVRSVFVDFVQNKESQVCFQTPAFLGIDEIKIKKLGEVTVITDLEHRTLYDMILGRNQESLTKYFSKLPDAGKVIWVCSDMYRPFEKSISTALPNARWVIDHFHIVMYANLALDTVRRTIQSTMSKAERIKTKKGLAYTLRTRLKDLSPEEAAKIKMCRNDKDLKPLAIAFDLKEDFFDIYDKNPTSKADAQEAFKNWQQSIPEDAIYDSFRKLAQTVNNYYEQIFNYWDCPIAISNGFTECTNRIIRENNVRGRGNSFEVLRGRTLFRKTNLNRAKGQGLLGPRIPAKGPVFHFEEANDISEEPVPTDLEDVYEVHDYDQYIGLKPYIDFDPETGEIFDFPHDIKADEDDDFMEE